MTLPTDHPLPPSFRIDERHRAFHLDPRDPVFFENPYPAYARLHASAPVAFWHEAGCLAVADHALVSAILKSRSFGRIVPAAETGRPDRGTIPGHLRNFYALENHSLLDLEAPAHTRLRGLVNRAFVSRQIERLAPSIEALSHELIEGFAHRGEVELVAAFAEPLPVRIIADLIGVPREEAPRLLQWSHAMVAMYQFGRNRTVEDVADRASAEFGGFLRDLITAKRREPGDDLASALVAAEADGGRLTEDEMVSTIVLLLNAGHEATVHQIGNGLAALLGSDASLGCLASDDAVAEAAVEEALRFDTPLHLFRRVALQDTEVAGFPLKRGEEVALLLGAANHDPKVFPEPGRFRLDRGKPAHVSFGAGIHFCIGAPLARLELRIAFQALAQKLRGLRLAQPLRFRDSYHFRGVERLHLAFDATGGMAPSEARRSP